MNEVRTTVSDEEISELLAFEGDLARHAAVDPFKMRALLTELQHRREAEAGGWSRSEAPLERFVLVRPIGLHHSGEPFTPTVAQCLDWSGTRRWYTPMNEIEPIEFGESIEQDGLPDNLRFHGTEWRYLPDDPALSASPSSPASGVRVKTGIYVASKVKHAEMWRDLRSFEKMPIISTWIDELYPDDMDGLWQRCISEASNAQVFLILRRPDEALKGAWIELGAALASGVPVYAVGIEEYTVAKDKRIRHFPNLVEARAAIRSALGEHP